MYQHVTRLLSLFSLSLSFHRVILPSVYRQLVGDGWLFALRRGSGANDHDNNVPSSMTAWHIKWKSSSYRDERGLFFLFHSHFTRWSNARVLSIVYLFLGLYALPYRLMESFRACKLEGRGLISTTHELRNASNPYTRLFRRELDRYPSRFAIQSEFIPSNSMNSRWARVRLGSFRNIKKVSKVVRSKYFSNRGWLNSKLQRDITTGNYSFKGTINGRWFAEESITAKPFPVCWTLSFRCVLRGKTILGGTCKQDINVE